MVKRPGQRGLWAGSKPNSRLYFALVDCSSSAACARPSPPSSHPTRGTAGEVSTRNRTKQAERKASKMSDDVIWHCIRHNHCGFMAKITTGMFCRNPYNATGICNRSSCPLANSRYATIRDHDGIFYLYMKTAERAHLPNKLWERVKLPRNYEKAIEVINKHLEFWPKLLVHKIKQRLTKMTQYRIRMRKLRLKVREKVMTMPRKQSQRDLRRMAKAEYAAQIEKAIERELKERLCGDNGMIYSYPFKELITSLDMEKGDVDPEEDEEEEVEEYVEGDYMDDMEDMEDYEGLPGGDYGSVELDEDIIYGYQAKDVNVSCAKHWL
uniref:Ribosomal eL28/Mak16 domain-containing protein n=1 Tax=Oryza meridionalis TaxID=40149 RepID=A0A0E0EA13_9ORYZ